MADDRKFTNNSDTDDYIFDDEEDLSLEEIELNEENDGQIRLYSSRARITARALSQSPFRKKVSAAT